MTILFHQTVTHISFQLFVHRTFNRSLKQTSKTRNTRKKHSYFHGTYELEHDGALDLIKKSS